MLAFALTAGVAVSVMLFLGVLGPRADFSAAIALPWYPLKIVILAGIAAAVLPAMEALGRPGARASAAWLLLPGALLGIAVVADVAILGTSGALMRLQGKNWLHCLSLVPLFAAAPLVAVIAAVRGGAATHPARAGFAAGLLSGAIGGFLYGIYCPDDSPLFVAVWYTLAIGLVAGIGALAGRFLCRW